MPGMLGARLRSPKISMQTIADRAHRHIKKAELDPVWGAFFDEIKVAAEEVSDEEAMDAAKRLSRNKTIGRYAKTTGLMAAAYPLVAGAGEAAKGYIEHGLPGATAGFMKSVTGGELGKNVTKGALSGSMLQAAREMIDRGEDKRIVKKYISEQGHGSSY